MHLSLILGHQKNIEFLRRSVLRGNIAHAYLFWGEDQVGKKKVAVEFAKMILCPSASDAEPCGSCKTCADIDSGIYADVNMVGPEKSGVISIAQIRALRSALSLTPLNGKYKIAVIDDAQNLNPEAANAFLKTIEEPSGNAVIVLVSSAPNFLPQTILSRVQQVRFSRMDSGTLVDFLKSNGLSNDEALDLIRLSENKPGKIINFLGNKTLLADFKKEIREFSAMAASEEFSRRFSYVDKIKNDGDFQRFFATYLGFFRDVLLAKSGNEEYMAMNFQQKEINDIARKTSIETILNSLKTAEKINNLSLTSNMNLKLAAEFLLLKTI